MRGSEGILLRSSVAIISGFLFNFCAKGKHFTDQSPISSFGGGEGSGMLSGLILDAIEIRDIIFSFIFCTKVYPYTFQIYMQENSIKYIQNLEVNVKYLFYFLIGGFNP